MHLRVREMRRRLVRELHRHGIYRLGPHPFGAFDRSLMLRDFGITTVFDVGANVGGWAAQLRERGFEGRIISLEPSSQSFAALAERASRDPAWEVHQAAAGERDDTAVFHLASNATSSSLLTVTDRFAQEHPGVVVKDQESVNVWQLDRFVHDIGTGQRVWIKLDVEGNELATIRGAGRLLAQATCVEVELATERLYDGEALFFEVAPALYELGFVLIAVASAFTGPSGRTVRFDGLFARPE